MPASGQTTPAVPPALSDAFQRLKGGESVYAVLRGDVHRDLTPAHVTALKNFAALQEAGDRTMRRYAGNELPSTAADLAELASATTRGPALQAIRNGESMLSVTSRMGTPSGSNQRTLQTEAALHAIRQGGSVETALKEHVVSSPMVANDVRQVAALLGSEDGRLRAHARNVDITSGSAASRQNLADLERLTAAGPGVEAIGRGEAAGRVIERMGIVQLKHAKTLRNASAVLAYSAAYPDAAEQAAVRSDLRPLIQKSLHGDAQSARRLEQVAAGTAARNAVLSGQPAHAVAAEMGIDSRHAVAELEQLQTTSADKQRAALASFMAQTDDVDLRDALRVSIDDFEQARQEGDPSADRMLQELALVTAGVDAVKGGAAPAEVDRQMGLGGGTNLGMLKQLAALTKSDQPGERAFASRQSFENLDSNRAYAVIEKVATGGPATRAVQGGEGADAVASRMGISDTNHVGRLQQLERQAQAGRARADMATQRAGEA